MLKTITLAQRLLAGMEAAIAATRLTPACTS
jgi:hypothetical protein